jgi:hypothetical protein
MSSPYFTIISYFYGSCDSTVSLFGPYMTREEAVCITITRYEQMRKDHCDDWEEDYSPDDELVKNLEQSGVYHDLELNHKISIVQPKNE